MEKTMLDKFNYINMKTYYTLMKNQQAILKSLVFTTFFLGIIGFFYANNQSTVLTENNSSTIGVINNTFGLFVAEWNDDKNWILDLARLSGIILLFFSFLILFFEEFFDLERVRFAQKKPYDLIVGLTEQNVSLLKNTYHKESVIIVEKDKNHKYVKYFKNKGYPVIEGHTKETLNNLDYSNMIRCIISTENDRKNIALGKLLLNKRKEIEGKKLYICIENRDLNVLFKQDIITSDIKNNINVVTYSLYQNMAKQLFLEHNILGNRPEIIRDSDDFNMILVGNSDLAVELVYHISFLSALPNENSLTLYLVGIGSEKFKNRVKKIFPNIDKIPHLTLESVELDNDTLDFYKDNVWESPNLTNIFVATKDEEKNLEITINLQDTTYIKKIGYKRFKTKVLFALYHNRGLANEIDNNQKAFANFYSFGNISTISTKKILIDEEFDKIAKLIHNDYKGEKDVFSKTLNKEWLKASQLKQDSNKTQALHLDIKLLAFGLKREASNKDFHERLKINKKLFYEKLEENKEVQNKIDNFKLSDFPTLFETTIEKVARAEHNRWCAFHYLNGWEYNAMRNDDAKEHHCLQPFKNFTTNEAKETYRYDLASVYFIAVYVARAGFEIKNLTLSTNAPHP